MEENNSKKTYKKSIFGSIFEWIYRTFMLTLGFLLFSILGLGLFGIGPALKAAQSIALIWLNDEDVPFFKTYWQLFKENYFESVATSFLFIFMIASPIVSYFFVIDKVSDQFTFGLLIGLASLFLVFGITGLSFVYYFVNKYEIKYDLAIKYALTITWGKIWGVMLNLLIIVILVLLSYFVFFIIGFFLFGVYALMSTFLAEKMFSRIDDYKIKNNL